MDREFHIEFNDKVGEISSSVKVIGTQYDEAIKLIVDNAPLPCGVLVQAGCTNYDLPYVPEGIILHRELTEYTSIRVSLFWSDRKGNIIHTNILEFELNEGIKKHLPKYETLCQYINSALGTKHIFTTDAKKELEEVVSLIREKATEMRGKEVDTSVLEDINLIIAHTITSLTVEFSSGDYEDVSERFREFVDTLEPQPENGIKSTILVSPLEELTQADKEYALAHGWLVVIKE